MTRPLSLSYYTVPELTPPETVAVAAETGCRHVGLRLLGGQPGGGEMPLLAEPALRRDTRGALAQHGITALDANTVRIVQETRVLDYVPFLDAAAELGARHVLTTVDDPNRTRATESVSHLCDLAAARGLTIDLEFVPWLQLANLADAARLVRDCGHDAIGISVDALHFFRSGSAISALRKMPPSWFRYAQICDAANTDGVPSRDRLIDEATKERLLPGDGDIDIAGLLHALPGAIPLALEIPQTTLAATLDSRERVLRAVAATQRVLREAELD